MEFVSLDADDVIYQDGASAYLNAAPNAAPETTSSGAPIPNGTVTYNHGYTGDLSRKQTTPPSPTTGTDGRTCRRCGWSGRWPTPATTRAWT